MAGVSSSCAILLICVLATEASEVSKKFQALNLNDKLFTTDILFDTVVRSKGECSSLCAQKENCFTFTFVKGQGQCRGHTFVMTTLHASLTVPGAKSYELVSGYPAHCGVVDGNWKLIQRRVQGGVDFWIGWGRYKAGFGDLCGDFWLGLERIHQLTMFEGHNTMRLELENWDLDRRTGVYTSFLVDSESTDYLLVDCSGYSGNLGGGDTMFAHISKPFSTIDHGDIGCANNGKGGWWYGGCMACNLNGYYYKPPTALAAPDDGGISWFYWYGTYKYSFKYSSMAVKP